MKTTFYFVRHGETDRNTKGKLPDGLNDLLNEKGKSQARETSKNVPVKNIDIVVTSPLSRAQETGEIICNELGCTPIVKIDDRLKEVNFGNFKNMTWEEVENLYPNKNLKENYRLQEYDFAEHDGDSFEKVRNRVYACIAEIKQKYPGKTILVPTHAGIIRCIYKTEKNYVFPDAPSNASVHEFIF